MKKLITYEEYKLQEKNSFVYDLKHKIERNFFDYKEMRNLKNNATYKIPFNLKKHSETNPFEIFKNFYDVKLGDNVSFGTEIKKYLNTKYIANYNIFYNDDASIDFVDANNFFFLYYGIDTNRDNLVIHCGDNLILKREDIPKILDGAQNEIQDKNSKKISIYSLKIPYEINFLEIPLEFCDDKNIIFTGNRRFTTISKFKRGENIKLPYINRDVEAAKVIYNKMIQDDTDITTDELNKLVYDKYIQESLIKI